MAAQNGSLVLVGTRSRRTYNIDIYLPDAAATYWSFNPNGAAASTSPQQFVLPEEVQLYDFSLTTAPTATNATFMVNNISVPGGVIRYANQLTSLPNRQKFNIVIPAGAILQALQA